MSDTRESPYFAVAELMQMRGYDYITFDPYCPEFNDKPNIVQTLENADGVFIITGHDEIIQYLNGYINNFQNINFILDGRNVLDVTSLPDNIVYEGMGTR